MVPQAVSATTPVLVLRFVEHFLLVGGKDRPNLRYRVVH
jgi:hypothetical protein